MKDFRMIIDSGLLVMCIAGLIAWGSSQAEQARLIKDMESLNSVVSAQIRNTKDIEYMKEQQRRQTNILERLERKSFGNNYYSNPIRVPAK